MRKVLLATFVTAGGLLLFAAPVAAQSLPDIAVDQVVRGTPGSVHLVGTDNVDPNYVGRACDVSVTAGNNESVHPNTDFLINSGTDQMIVPNVEQDAYGIIDTAGTLVLGDTITVYVRLGPDGVFSGGFTISIASSCRPPTTPTTTVTPTTTAPQTAAAGQPNVSVLTEQGALAAGSGAASSDTLPHTGPSTDRAVVAGTASLIVGLGVLAGVRRRRTTTN